MKFVVVLGLFALGAQVQASETFVSRSAYMVELSNPGKAVLDPAYAMAMPPEAATQRNVKVSFEVTASNGQKAKGEQLVIQEIEMTIGGVKQPGYVVRVVTTGPTDPFANGTKFVAKIEFDRHSVNALGQAPATDSQKYTGETSAANYSSAGFQQFIKRYQLQAAFNNGDYLVPFIQAVGQIPYSSTGRASRADLSIRGGSCGDHSLALEALFRWTGLAARSAVGYCALKSRKLENHCWVEVSDTKSWLPIEATFEYKDNPLKALGRTEESLIMHFGFGVYAEYKDHKGRRCVINEPDLQMPKFFGSPYPGQNGWVNRGNKATISRIG